MIVPRTQRRYDIAWITFVNPSTGIGGRLWAICDMRSPSSLRLLNKGSMMAA
jgi:hypothetical protein